MLPPPSRRDPSIPKALDELIGGCLRVNPAHRFASGGELVAALQRLGPNGDDRESVVGSKRITARPWRALLLTGAVVVPAGILAVWALRSLEPSDRLAVVPVTSSLAAS